MQFRMRHMRAILWTIVLLVAATTAASAHTSVLRNGSFSDGLDGWMLNSELLGWNPVTADMAVSLDPPVEGFTGTVLYQNLNVADIGGKSFELYLWFRKVRAWSANTVAVYVDYVDSANALHHMKILSPANDDIAYQGWTVSSHTFSFPSDAVKLVKLSFAKEDYGAFDVDGVMLLADAVVPIGLVPEITGLSAFQGSYGSMLTVYGVGFGSSGSANCRVTIGGASDGLSIESWSDTRIDVRVEEPSRSGPVRVTASGVESDGYPSYTITSPSLAVSVSDPVRKVVRGQVAEFTVSTDFGDGFTVDDGVTFSVPEAPAGAVTFSPGSLQYEGGVEMSIDTTNLTAGTYEWHVEAAVEGHPVRSAPFTLKVVTVTDARFYTPTDGGGRQTVTSLSITSQQRLYLYCEATGSDGELLPDDVPVTLSSGSGYLQVFPRPWGGYEIYVYSSITTGLTASYPDGFTETLPVMSSIPSSPRIQAINVLPSPVSNSGAETIDLGASGTEAIDADFDYSLWTLDGWTQSWSNGDRVFMASGSLPQGTIPGMYLFHAQIRSDHAVERAHPFTIVNDSSRGMVKGSVYCLAGGWIPDPSAMLEFYDTSGVKAGEYTIAAWGEYTAPCIQPGTYRLRLVAEGFEPQWHPNCYAFSAAEPVAVTAGGIAEDVSFFLNKASAEAPAVSRTDPADGADNVPADKTLTAVFSKPIDTSTVTTSTFTVTDAGGSPVLGTVTSDGVSASFDPSENLEVGTTYTASVTTGVQDTAGRPMSADYTWSFTAGNNLLSDLRDLPNDAPVSIADKVLYYVQDGVGYIEEPDRATGIRIEGTISASENSVVSVSGTMQTTTGGERYIAVGSISTSDSGNVDPLGASNRSLGLRMMDGLHVKAWGRVAAGSVTPTGFRIGDGSDEVGIEVRTATAPTVSEGEYVTITGAAGWDGARVIYME